MQIEVICVDLDIFGYQCCVSPHQVENFDTIFIYLFAIILAIDF
jgi:hypothetical protein